MPVPSARYYWPSIVHEVGVASDGQVYIQVYKEDQTLPRQWYIANSSVKKEILSVALTAIATGNKVSVCLSDKPPVQYAEITFLSLLRQGVG